MRWIFWTSAAVIGGVALMGLSRNGEGKFVRIVPQPGCLVSYANLSTSDEEPRELVCCTGSTRDEGVCIAGRNPTTQVLTSKLAFVIPLLALVVNALCDWLAGSATTARIRARRNRFWLYVSIVLGRTLVLYLVLNFIEEKVQAEETSHCWYAHLRRSGKCSEQFDFADHVVLAVCQYFAIQVFEFACTVQEYRDLSRPSAAVGAASASELSRKPLSSSSSMSSFAASSSSSSSSSTSTRRPLPPSRLLCFLPATGVCAAVGGAALLLVYDTAAYFHSAAETLVALAISWFVVGSPLLSLMGAGLGGGGGGEGAMGEKRRGRAGTSWGSPPLRGVFLAAFPEP